MNQFLKDHFEYKIALNYRPGPITSNDSPTNNVMVKTPRQTEQLGHATCWLKTTPFYTGMHVCNIKLLIFLFEVWNFWVSGPVKQLRLKWPK